MNYLSCKAYEIALKQGLDREIKLWQSLDRWLDRWCDEYVRNMRLAHRLQVANGSFVPPTDFSLHFRLLAITSGGCSECDGVVLHLNLPVDERTNRIGLFCVKCGHEVDLCPKCNEEMTYLDDNSGCDPATWLCETCGHRGEVG